MKLESSFVKPARARFLVIFERKPKQLKLTDLLAVSISQEVNDVGDSQASELRNVSPSGYHAAKGQALSHEESFHRHHPLACL